MIRERSREYDESHDEAQGSHKHLDESDLAEVMGSRKRRLAFLDMLLYEAKNGGANLDFLDIREEVDTFMFEVRSVESLFYRSRTNSVISNNFIVWCVRNSDLS